MPADSSQAKKLSKRKVVKIDNPRKQRDIPEKNQKIPAYDPDELIFALDIGTRTIIGIVGIQEKDVFKVLAAEVIEHKNRAMLDGQIHDINQVAEVAREVKEKLEKSVGINLKKVAIAAAGRVLLTCETRTERDIEQGREIDKDIISSLELEGIQRAQMGLDEESSSDGKTQFYCVGYSVINYFLNGYVISSLLGHKGKRMGVDILATFLPHIVVDSLYTVMGKIGLEVTSLTLEPIAAINVTIPKDLRLLNLALVDIGAGTSDIAITRDGSVVAYAMAPVAGDEITERIAQHYLVDFNTSEKIKISVSRGNESVTFTDILGKKQTVRSEEVLEAVRQPMGFLAETISEKILEFNHKSPNAVFLIGGGSQIPGLTGMIAESLKLPEDRVVVRGRDIIQNISFKGKKLSGPEAITPLGIAITAQIQKGQDFLSITLNGKKIRLFNSRKLTVADALILTGFNPGDLIGRSGKSTSFSLNGEKKTIRGEHGTAAEIFVNDIASNLETELQIGDNIRIVPAVGGKNAEVKPSDFIRYRSPRKVSLNCALIHIDAKTYINGSLSAPGTVICDGDEVRIIEIATLGELLSYCGKNEDYLEILVNGNTEQVDYYLKNDDNIECIPIRKIKPEQKDAPLSNPVTAQESREENTDKTQLVEDNNSAGNLQYGLNVSVNGKTVVLDGTKTQHIFVDIFNYIDFDLTRPKGNIMLKLNGAKAGFTDTIRGGDIVEVYWEKDSS